MRNRICNWLGNLKWLSVVGIFLVSASANASQAQETDPADSLRSPAQEELSARKEKRKALSFEDELVEGSTQKPELFYLFQKKNFNYKRLIKLRENFLPEMRKTSEDLQRARSSN